MTPAGFECATPGSDRPQTLALDRSATGIGIKKTVHMKLDYYSVRRILASTRHVVQNTYGADRTSL
jgi:hypothetical protein